MRRINHSSRFIEQFAKCGHSHKLGDVVKLMDDKRKPINDAERQSMKTGELYPYYGATGQVDRINSYLTDDTLLCIAEDCGNYRDGEESSYIITGKAWVNNHAHLVKPNDDCDITFLHYYLTFCDLSPYVTGTTRQKLTQKSLVSIPVILPSIGEQRSFVSIVQQADKSKFSDFKSRFIEMFGDQEKNTRGFKHYSFTDVSDFQGGSQPPKNEWSSSHKDGYIRMLQIRDFTQSEKDNIEYVKISSSTKQCDENDVLIGRYGASVGKILTGLAGAYNVAIMKCIPNPSIIDNCYLYYYLNSKYFQDRIIKISSSRGAQAGFNKEDLSTFKIVAPPLPLQASFKAIVQQADKSKYLN